MIAPGLPPNSMSARTRLHADTLLFLALVPLTAHLALSWMGFNPTDDGFVLAHGRRILDGQVPHLDFISIRPVGSPLLHLPELLLAGDLVLYASRFVWWCELAVVAWVWVGLLATLLEVDLDARERLAIRLLVVMLTAHVAPPRAWHTVDGIFLASLGLGLASGPRPPAKALGYLLVGAAGLCKQNFLALAPAALLGLGDWGRPRYWIAVVVPGALYVSGVILLGGGPDLLAQVGVAHDLVSAGLAAYLSNPMVAIGVVVGALAGWLPRLASRHGALAWSRGIVALGPLSVLLAPLGLLATALTGSYTLYGRIPAFALFGVALGRLSALPASGRVPAMRAAFLGLAVAWASSVSYGYATLPRAARRASRSAARRRLSRRRRDPDELPHPRVPERPAARGGDCARARAAVRDPARPAGLLGRVSAAEPAPHRLAAIHRAARPRPGSARHAEHRRGPRPHPVSRAEGAGRVLRDLRVSATRPAAPRGGSRRC